MATTKTTEEKFNGTGSQTVYPFTIEYLATSDLQVFVSNVLQTETTHYSISGSSLTFVTAPPSGTGNVKISRSTGIDKARAVYAAGSSVRAVDLNANQDQALFALQERVAKVGTLVSSAAPTTPAAGDKWYDTVSGRLFVYYEDVDSSQWVEASPAHETTNAPQITSISDAQVVSNAAINSTKLSFTQTGTGAVARTLDDRLKEFVSVKDFGAVGDGIADDTSAIQAAINTNKNITFPIGRYKVSDTITIPQAHVGQILHAVTGNANYPSVAFKPNAEIIGDLSSITSSGSLTDLASAKPMFLVQAAGVKFQGLYLNGTSNTKNSIGIKVELTADTFRDDADGQYNDCMLGNWQWAIYHKGRGIGVNDCNIFTSYTGILLDWPSNVNPSQIGIAVDDDYANRGVQIRDNQFHGVFRAIQHIGSFPLIGASIVGNHLDIGQALFEVGVDNAHTITQANITEANPGVFTKTNHGLPNGTQLTYNSRGGTNLATSAGTAADETVFYVVNALTDTFQIAATSGGTPLQVTNDGNDSQCFKEPVVAAETRDTLISSNVVMFSASRAGVKYNRGTKSVRDHIINNHFSGGINTEGTAVGQTSTDRTPLYHIYFRSCHTIQDLSINNNFLAYSDRHSIAFINEDFETAAVVTAVSINNNTCNAWGFTSTSSANRGAIAVEIPTSYLSIRGNTFKNTYSTTECIRFNSSTQTNLHISDNTLTAGVLYNGANVTVSGNRLDSTYSVGTFTPTLANVSAPTYSAQTGSYIKIGQLVNVWITLTYSGLSTSDTSAYSISGLPFAHDIDQALLGFDANTSDGLGNKGNVTGAAFTGSTTISLMDATGPFTYADSNDAAGTLKITFAYKSTY